MKFIIGKKLNMTQVWRDDKVIAGTRVQAGPCLIVQIKTKDKDGYGGVQLGFGEKKEKNIKKPQKGHLSKLKVNSPTGEENAKVNLRYLREFRCDNKDLKVGDVIDASTFALGDIIDVVGISKGKGFQGVVKRHGFSGAPKSHGTKDQLRMPGSIGATGPAHVFKGQRMPGRMGGNRVTVKNLEIVEIDKENNVLLIEGAVPGARNGLLLIQGKGELKVKTKKENVKAEEKVEDTGKQETKNKDGEKKDKKIKS